MLLMLRVLKRVKKIGWNFSFFWVIMRISWVRVRLSMRMLFLSLNFWYIVLFWLSVRVCYFNVVMWWKWIFVLLELIMKFSFYWLIGVILSIWFCWGVGLCGMIIFWLILLIVLLLSVSVNIICWKRLLFRWINWVWRGVLFCDVFCCLVLFCIFFGLMNLELCLIFV